MTTDSGSSFHWSPAQATSEQLSIFSVHQSSLICCVPPTYTAWFAMYTLYLCYSFTFMQQHPLMNHPLSKVGPNKALETSTEISYMLCRKMWHLGKYSTLDVENCDRQTDEPTKRGTEAPGRSLKTTNERCLRHLSSCRRCTIEFSVCMNLVTSPVKNPSYCLRCRKIHTDTELFCTMSSVK